MNNEGQYANLELGKTYNFMGYKWTACELINNGKTLVIQSHVVTNGAWPGLVISQFGNGNYYSKSIDGQDISGYDNKLVTIKGVKESDEYKMAQAYNQGLRDAMNIFERKIKG